MRCHGTRARGRRSGIMIFDKTNVDLRRLLKLGVLRLQGLEFLRGVQVLPAALHLPAVIRRRADCQAFAVLQSSCPRTTPWPLGATSLRSVQDCVALVSCDQTSGRRAAPPNPLVTLGTVYGEHPRGVHGVQSFVRPFAPDGAQGLTPDWTPEPRGGLIGKMPNSENKNN